MTGVPPRSSFTSSRGNKYSYMYARAAAQRPTFIFLHGFPSHSYDWLLQIRQFSARGFGVVAPDLLGYAGTSAPADVDAYRLRPMSDEIVELLGSLGLHRVIGVGHDFGATLLSRAAAYHPSRWRALVFLAVGPPKPGTPLDVNAINRMTKEAMGYELLGYIPWLGGDPGAQNLLETRPEAAMSLMFAADASAWDTWFRPLGKMKDFVADDRRVPVGDWYPDELRRAHLEVFGRPGGYMGAVRWYRMLLENLSTRDEAGHEAFTMEQPTLFVAPREPAAATTQQQQMLGAWTPNVETVLVDSGHWVHLECAADTNEAIEKFAARL